MATFRPPLDHRIKSLARDLEAVEQIRDKMPVLDWGDHDVVLVHSAANMLHNELNVLRKSRCAREGAGLSLGIFTSSRVKAALRSAGHRALRSVTLVFPAIAHGTGHGESDESSDCPASKLERASSSPSVRGAVHEPADDGSGHRLQRKVRFSSCAGPDDLVMSEGSSVDQGDRAVAIIDGSRMLPMSGTF